MKNTLGIIVTTVLLELLGAGALGQDTSAKSDAATKVLCIDHKVGTGQLAVSGSQVKVHYTGWLYVDGQRRGKFDSSIDREEPFSFVVGSGQVIKGLDDGVQGMKVGGIRELIIPSNLAYGLRGAGRVIPPNATLDYEIELLAIDRKPPTAQSSSIARGYCQWATEGAGSKGRRTRPVRLPTDQNGMSLESVVITTDRGTIRFRFYPNDAPCTVTRIRELIVGGFYDGLTFHRLIPGFIIQGGDPLGNGTGGSGKRIAAEFNGRPHVEGTVAMARAKDPDSADSQFYISFDRFPHLDGAYTVFGQVVEGMDVVRKLKIGDIMRKVTIDIGSREAKTP
jgi:cyclophilin family peptidyl-prolyl cis-trans isomerase